MQELYEGTPYELMPEVLRTSENEAISYAISKGLKKLLNYTKAISLYGDISQVSDAVLDAMAAELRTQYYDASASRIVREGMVKQTLGWYMRGGTNATLSEYLTTLYGGGQIEEWFDYDGDPYYFKAVVNIAEDTVIPIGSTKEIIRKINGYKNVRSWLEALIFQILIEIQVSTEVDACVRLFMEFYPRQNLVPLRLDGSWKLDGDRKFNGYKSNSQVDFYPLGIRIPVEFAISMSVSVPSARIQSAVEVPGEYCNALRIEMETEEEEDTEASLRIGFTVQTNPDLTTKVYSDRKFDGSWKLDGTRKLNGGWAEL